MTSTPAKIRAFWQKWAKRLPHPFPAKDRAGGYRYELFIQQAEFARTQGRRNREIVVQRASRAAQMERMAVLYDALRLQAPRPAERAA